METQPFNNSNRPTIICLTPVKNEEWIIEKFLKAASIWADRIIISDQGSEDRTLEIARKFKKVTIIDNSGLKEFNEKAMRTPLFNEARKIPGRKILISLDADEMFTPNFDSIEWETILNAPEGTVLRFNWLHIQPGFETVLSDMDNPCGLVDDGSEYDVGLIHVPRQPIRSDVLHIKLNDIQILHFQFTNWGRMERKHVWYQMYERINFPKKSFLTLYRLYHYERQPPLNSTTISKVFDKKWIDKYADYDIDISSVNMLPQYHWDANIAKYINEIGLKYFRKIDFGNYDFCSAKSFLLESYDEAKFQYKRRLTDNLFLFYVKKTQKRKDSLYIKIIDKIIQFFC